MHTLLRRAALAAACLSLGALQAQAQSASTPDRCQTVEYMQELRRLNPDLETEADFERRIAQAVADERTRMATARTQDEVMYIPVVVHVIHQGQAVGTGANLSDRQILSQIKVLNDDFRRNFNSRGWNTDPRGADTRIEFVLARRDPNGLPTTGINRVAASSIGLAGSAYTRTQLDGTIKPRTVWDATRYMNLWVANVSGLFGVAQFPLNSSLGGLACTPQANAANTDGITINTTSCGSIDDGPFNLNTATLYGRTATHEVGHYLGLRHIWGDANCGNDFCEDTPIHQTANRGCPTHPKPNNCGTADEMFENYMDYTDDQCYNIFSRDQMIRMRAVLRTSPRRRELITSTGLIPPITNDAAIAEVLSPLRDVCTTSANGTVEVKNMGSTPLTSVKLWAQVNGGTATSPDKTVNILPGTTAPVAFTGLPLQPGINRVVYWVTDPNGQPDQYTGFDTLETNLQVTAGMALPTAQDFEGVSTPPTNWSIANPTLDCKTWRMASVPTGPGGVRSVAAMFSFFQGTVNPRLRDELTSPLYNLAGDTSAYLIFSLAHARTSTAASGSGTLRIDISTDCGATWDTTTLYNKTGAALSTLSNNVSSAEWYPNQVAQWRQERINLRAYVGQTVRLRFVALNTGGNNLYLDNITLARGTPTPPVITRLVPDSGSIGSTVSIIGRGLLGAQQATFNTTNTLFVTVLNDTLARAIVPVGATTGTVRITTPQGAGSSLGFFTVVQPPTISSFTPGVGNVGTRVQLTGSGLRRVVKVYVNGTQADSLAIASANSLRFTIADGSTTGPVAIVTEADSVLSSTSFVIGDFVTVRNGADTLCSGMVVSPNYPANYANNANVTYLLVAERGQEVELAITNFNTATGDQLQIYDGPTTTSPLLVRLTGFIPGPPTVRSTTGVLTLRWTTTASGTNTGFVGAVRCVPAPAPQVFNMSPRQGPIGFNFALLGTNMSSVDTVWFGNIPVTQLTRSFGSVSGVVPVGATTTVLQYSAKGSRVVTSQTYVVTEGRNYCAPAYGGCQPTSGIRRVRLVGSNLQTATTCSDASGPAFTYFPMADSATATVFRGATYQLQVFSRGSDRVGAWMDYNRNGVLESTEYIIAQRQPTATTPGLLTVRIPDTLSTGMIGFRILTKLPIAAGDACATASSGSGVHFTLTVGTCPTVAGPASVLGDTVCAGSQALLTASGTGTYVWFTSPAGGLNLDTAATYTATVIRDTTFYVAALEGVCFSPRQPVSVTALPLPVATITVNGTTLSVPAASQGPGFTYQWFRDGNAITGATADTFALQPDPAGSYTVRITSAEGCQATSAPLIVTATAPQLAGWAIQPNPSAGVFTVSGLAKATSATLQDLTGRTLWQGTATTGTRLDLSAQPKGIYLLRLQGQAPVRLIVQ